MTKLNTTFVRALVTLAGALVTLMAQPLFAAIYTVSPGDDWTKIEQATAGDVVEIAPGTYQFRVYLNQEGTVDAPIVIRAQDPSNRPVWDLEGDEAHPVSSWPGSYGAGDLGRGAWQVGPQGAHYHLSGIIFRNSRDSSAAGLRMINSGPVVVTDCLFEQNTNGLTGASDDLLVEHSEFRQNGKIWEGGAMTHNIYIYGGKFTMRYCYDHDAHEGQLFHVRAATALLAYNWFARPASYVGDMMSCNYLCGDTGYEMSMTLLGNVIIQGNPQNGSQILAMFHDEDIQPAAMNLTLAYNTIIGTPRNQGQTHNLVNMRNDTVPTHVTVNNNIIYQVGRIAEATNPSLSNWSLRGTNNWCSTGTAGDELENTLFGDDPGFNDLDNMDYTLNATAQAANNADPSVEPLPQMEYYRNELTPMMARVRNSATEIGAFEISSDEPVLGPGEPKPDTDVVDTSPGAPNNGESDSDSWATDTDSTNQNDGLSDDGGCNCTVTGHKGHHALLYMLINLL